MPGMDKAQYNEALGAAVDSVISAADQPASQPSESSDTPVFERYVSGTTDPERYLDDGIKYMRERGQCGCGDDTHFDEQGVLRTMLELNTSDMRKAWRAWHDQTFSNAKGDAHLLKNVHRVKRDGSRDREPTNDRARLMRNFNQNLDAAIASMDTDPEAR